MNQLLQTHCDAEETAVIAAAIKPAFKMSAPCAPLMAAKPLK
jgi:hypothetical protein